MKTLRFFLILLSAFRLLTPFPVSLAGDTNSDPNSRYGEEDSDVKNGLPFPDGLTNDEEAVAGTKPKNPDTDGDFVIDGLDAVGTEVDFTHRRLPAARYAVIDTGMETSEYGASYTTLSSSGVVACISPTGEASVWDKGVVSKSEANSAPVIYGVSNDGLVVGDKTGAAFYLSKGDTTTSSLWVNVIGPVNQPTTINENGLIGGSNRAVSNPNQTGSFTKILCAAKGLASGNPTTLSEDWATQAMIIKGSQEAGGPLFLVSGSAQRTFINNSGWATGVRVMDGGNKFDYEAVAYDGTSVIGLGDKTRAQGINDYYDWRTGEYAPMIVGNGYINLRRNGAWLEKAIGGNGFSISDRVEVLEYNTNRLWRNGKWINLLDSFTPPANTSSWKAHGINSRGMIVATAKKGSSQNHSAYLLLPVEFAVKTTSDPVLILENDTWMVKAWEFTATVKIPNIPGETNKIKCGLMRDMKFVARINRGSVSEECQSPGYLFDLPSTTFAPNAPQPNLFGTDSQLAVLMPDNSYKWTLGEDQPAIGVSAAQFSSTVSIFDEGLSRYFLYVQMGTAAPEIISQVNISYTNLFTTFTNPDGTKTLVPQPAPLSKVNPPFGKTIYGRSVINEPLKHSDGRTSAALEWIRNGSHWH